MTNLMPPGATEHSIETSKGTLRILRGGEGQGRPIVLIHGGGSDNAAISWYRLFAPLSAHHDVIAPDLPGFGGSIDVDPVGGPEAMADLVAEILDRQDMARAVVVGVSMGGDVALNLELRHPEKLRGLVLIAPGGLTPRIGSPVTHYSAWLTAQMPDWMLIPLARLANRFVKTTIRAMVKDPATLPPLVIEEFAREARHPKGGIGYGRYNQATIGRHGMNNDLSGRVHEITVPTLFFHGADDLLVSPENSRRAAAAMPNSKIVTVPNCGHWAQLEAHDLFLREAQAFLDNVDS